MKIKKLATLFATMAVGLGTAWAQGTIDFHCPSSQPLKVTDGTTTWTVNAAGSPLTGASVRVGLFVGPNGTTDINLMTMVGMVTNSASSNPLALGTFNGGNPFALPTGYPASSQVSFAFAAWSISTGALTYQAALSAAQGYVGVTPIGQNYALAGGVATPPAAFGTGAGQLTSLILQPLTVVPEPSTIALGLLGAGALLLRRRNK